MIVICNVGIRIMIQLKLNTISQFLFLYISFTPVLIHYSLVNKLHKTEQLKILISLLFFLDLK